MYVTDLLEEQGAFTHLEFWLPDHPAADILQHLPAAVAFVREALTSGGRVLVHCAMGISRSATVRPQLIFLFASDPTTGRRTCVLAACVGLPES